MRLFPNLKIAQKLPVALVGSAPLVSAGVGIASHLVGSATVMDLSRRQIETVASHGADASVEAARPARPARASPWSRWKCGQRAAGAYLSHGNAAIDAEWSEF